MSDPAPLNYSMGKGVLGSYDNKSVSNGKCAWRKEPCNNSLTRGPIYVPQGTPLPLANEERAVMPPDDSMFLFSHNTASLDCCPATYTTDRGCVCTTEQQRKYVGEMRGGNKTYPSEPDI